MFTDPNPIEHLWRDSKRLQGYPSSLRPGTVCKRGEVQKLGDLRSPGGHRFSFYSYFPKHVQPDIRLRVEMPLPLSGQFFEF